MKCLFYSTSKSELNSVMFLEHRFACWTRVNCFACWMPCNMSWSFFHVTNLNIIVSSDAGKEDGCSQLHYTRIASRENQITNMAWLKGMYLFHLFIFHLSCSFFMKVAEAIKPPTSKNIMRIPYKGVGGSLTCNVSIHWLPRVPLSFISL